MITGSASRWELVTLGGLLVAFAASWGCSWDESTDRRFETWKKTLDETIEQASKQKEGCNNRPDRTSKEACYRQWDELLQGMLKAKAAGATAYLQCDGSALDRILETVENLIKSAANLAGRRMPFTGQGGAVNLADRLDAAPINVQIAAQQISQNRNVRTYRVRPGSHVAVSFDHGASFDTYPAAGQIVLAVNPTPGLASCTLIDMDIVLDFEAEGTCSADLHVTDDPSNPTVFDLPFADGAYEGRMCGWLDYALDNWSLGGAYVTSLGAALDPTLTQLVLYTGPGQTSADVFPEEGEASGPYIYYAGVSTDLRIGQFATVEIQGVEPGAVVDLYGAFRLSWPTSQFQVALWDLNTTNQRYVKSVTAPPSGEVSITFRVPNRPILVGRTAFFQGLAHETAGNRSTIAFSAPILP
jgi:hypothetical protein